MFFVSKGNLFYVYYTTLQLLLCPVAVVERLPVLYHRKSELYTLFLDGTTLFMKSTFHLALDILGQPNRDLPCQIQYNDMCTQKKKRKKKKKSPPSLTRVFAVGSGD